MGKKVVNVGLIGFGTVGTGVVKLFKDNSDIINRKAGISVRLKSICDIKFKKGKSIGLLKCRLTRDARIF